MHRLVITVFIFAAFNQVAVCDFECFLEKHVEVFPTRYQGFTVDLCRPFREYFEAIRVAAKECKLCQINVTEALAFTKDICTVGWDLNNQYLKQQECFGDNLRTSLACGKKIEAYVYSVMSSPRNIYKWKQLLVAVCDNIEDTYTCFNEDLGESCGRDGLAFVKRMTTALSSFSTGLCQEVRGYSKNNAVSCITGLSEGVNGASTINTISWTILLVFFLFVLNLHKY